MKQFKLGSFFLIYPVLFILGGKPQNWASNALNQQPIFKASCNGSIDYCSMELDIPPSEVLPQNLSQINAMISTINSGVIGANQTIATLSGALSTFNQTFSSNQTTLMNEMNTAMNSLSLLNKAIQNADEQISNMQNQADFLLLELECIDGNQQACQAASTTTLGPTTTATSVPPSTISPSPTSGDLNWWKKQPIYQIYPRSFQDSNGDGTGDLQGIIQRLDYLIDIGIRSIWLNPIYDSPMKDFGYDISNFTHIDPLFGTIDDFKQLIKECHNRGMKLIMDFVPNHSSDQHPWFQASQANSTNQYSDYYVWVNQTFNGTTNSFEPINNWLSVFGNSSWQYEAQRKQTYLHQFLVAQPDLNYRNPMLRQEMENVLTYWLDQGVDGFRIDAVIFLIENNTWPNEPLSGLNVPENNYYHLSHPYTIDQPMMYAICQNWSNLFHSYGSANNKHIFSVYEGYTDVHHQMEFYTIGADFPFNFNLIPSTDEAGLNQQTTATVLYGLIEKWMQNMPAGKWPNWVVGNHDNHRVATRMGGTQYTDLVNTLLLLLPGTPTLYYGDEIGMADVFVPYNETKDPAGKKWGPALYLNYTRDPERTPMQWDSSLNAGFSSSTNGTWLPIANNSATVNVASQMNDTKSHLGIFRQLLQLRQQPTFLNYGENLQIFNVTTPTSTINEDLFVFNRNQTGGVNYLIVLDLGHGGRTNSLNLGLFPLSSVNPSGNGTVVLPVGTLASSGNYGRGTSIPMNSVISQIHDGDGLVIQYA